MSQLLTLKQSQAYSFELTLVNEDQKPPLSLPIGQACTTYGPRAKCGPHRLLIWPSKQKIFQIQLVDLVETPFEWKKYIDFAPRIFKNFVFWPATRFELCTPAIGNYIDFKIYGFLQSLLLFIRAWCPFKKTVSVFF